MTHHDRRSFFARVAGFAAGALGIRTTAKAEVPILRFDEPDPGKFAQFVVPERFKQPQYSGTLTVRFDDAAEFQRSTSQRRP